MYQPIDQAILASASRTTSPAAFEVPGNYVGADVVVDVTTPGTGSITVNIEGYAAGKVGSPAGWYTILASAALTTAATTVLTVHPGVTDTTNLKAGRPLPRRWRVRVVANNANAITYSVDANLYPAA